MPAGEPRVPLLAFLSNSSRKGIGLHGVVFSRFSHRPDHQCHRDEDQLTKVPISLFQWQVTRSVARQLVALAFESAFWPLIPHRRPDHRGLSRRRLRGSSAWPLGWTVELDESFNPGELDGFLGPSFAELHRGILLVSDDHALITTGLTWCSLPRCLDQAEVLLQGSRCALRGPKVLTCVPDLPGVTDPTADNVHVVLSVTDHHPGMVIEAHPPCGGAELTSTPSPRT
jgi:hypothetical protein